MGLYPNPHAPPLIYEKSLLKIKQKTPKKAKNRQQGERSILMANSVTECNYRCYSGTFSHSTTVSWYWSTWSFWPLKIFKVHIGTWQILKRKSWDSHYSHFIEFLIAYLWPSLTFLTLKTFPEVTGAYKKGEQSHEHLWVCPASSLQWPKINTANPLWINHIQNVKTPLVCQHKKQNLTGCSILSPILA